VLALHEAERAGATVKNETWVRTKAYWEQSQNRDGSWGYYMKSTPGEGGMTCAGIASLIIASDHFLEPNAEVVGDQILCCRPAEAHNDRIERAMQWLERNFSAAENPERSQHQWLLYYLYGVERVGRMTAQRFLGDHDWYREGCDFLANRQDPESGFWTGAGHDAEDDPLIGTSFALLFLSKGRRPIVMAKLRHSIDEEWNQHRSDVDNLTRYVESQWKRELSWQVVDLQSATVEDLLQSPVLYFCGNLNPLPQASVERRQLAQKLRDYLDRGGFLFAEGCCGASGDFDRGFRELMKLAFPEPEYRLRLLEPEHPIWRAEAPLPAAHVRPLEGIDFGCRTSVIYARPDPPQRPRPSLSCLWELSRSGRQQKFSSTVQNQIDAALTIGANVLAYATGRELKGKEESFRTRSVQQPSDTLDRGRLYVAKLRHPGGCNAAPRALVTLLDTANHEFGLRTKAREQLLDISDTALFDYHLVFMDGRNSFRLTETERAQLKTYVERGGMLLADAICANLAFADSFRREIGPIFPDRKLQRIPADDSLWTTTYGGFDLKTVSRRDPQNGGAGPLRVVIRKVPPELEGIRLDDRWGVVFSQYDLSCALEEQDSLECHGYAREDAAKIGLNVILYSLQR
jgi:hypothetical protein